MVLQLDSNIPAIYRSPTSLQFGASRPIVVLTNVDAAVERMVMALRGGITRPGLGMIARSAGATDAAAEQLLRTLAPVLRPTGGPPPESLSVVVCGSGRTAERIGTTLASTGMRVACAATAADAAASDGEIDAAVIVGHFTIEPELHGLWLRRDVPHLAVVLGDSEIAIGPFVEPGATACLYCLNAHATDRDPAWPAIASQLWGRRSPADIELHANEVAAIVTRLVLARGGGGSSVATAQLVIQCRSGASHERQFEPHPDCGCLEAGVANARALTGSDSACAVLPRDSSPEPTTGPAVCAPA